MVFGGGRLKGRIGEARRGEASAALPGAPPKAK